MTQRRDFLASLGAAALGAGLPAIGRAQAAPWPTARSISYICPIFPGSSADVISRFVAQKLGEALKQSVVVENKLGAGGTIGTTFAAKAAPDGYTLIGGTSGTHAINASLYRNLQYDPVRDFEPVALLGFVPNVLVVGPNLGVNSVADLIALMKRDEKSRTYGSAGAGTSPHLTGELFAETIGLPLTHVAYKAQPGIIDVASGELTFKFDQMSAALPLMQAGKVRILAVTSAQRIPQLPGVPTMIEAGVPGFEVVAWHAVYAPKGTPQPIIERLSTEVIKAIRSPEAKAKLTDFGVEVVGGTPADLSALMAREIPRWAEVVRRSGAKAQ